MSNHAHLDEDLGQIDALFAHAEQGDEFWISKAKYKFTEEMLSLMQKHGMKKGDLAGILGVKPAQITRLCSGDNNFTMGTLVRIARALNCELRTHLQPAGTNSAWIDFLDHEPARPSSESHGIGLYKTIGRVTALETSNRNEVCAVA
jgi:transcriptional regulator with XRE-family HTH domain